MIKKDEIYIFMYDDSSSLPKEYKDLTCFLVRVVDLYSEYISKVELLYVFIDDSGEGFYNSCCENNRTIFLSNRYLHEIKKGAVLNLYGKS